MGIRLEGVCPLLEVFDMARSLALYHGVLGFEIVESHPPGDDCHWCLLRLNGAELMLNTRYEKHDHPPIPDPARIAAGDTSLFSGLSGTRCSTCASPGPWHRRTATYSHQWCGTTE